MSINLGTAHGKITVDASGVEAGTKKASGALKGLQSVALGVAAGVGAAVVGIGAGMAAFGVAAVSAGAQAQEMLSKFNVVFATTGDRVEASIDQFAEAAGRSRFELLEMASTFGDTLKPMGFSEAAAADYAISLTELATDLGSFNNMEMDEALQRLQGTLIGSHENALAFGVIINENTLKAELAEQGWDNLTGVQLEQAKVQARMNLLMAGTTDAQGDAIRTADSFTNQMRGLKAGISDVMTEIGLKLLPILTPFLSKIGEIAKAVGEKLMGAFESLELPMQFVAQAIEALMEGDLAGFLDNIKAAVVGVMVKLGAGGDAIQTLVGIFDAIKGFFSNMDEGMSVLDAFIEAISDIAPQEVLDFFTTLRDTVIPAIQEVLDPIIAWIQENVGLKDILIVLAGVLLSIIVPAIIGVITAIAPILLTIGAIILIVALLRKAWESNFLGIQDKVQEVIGFIRRFWDENGPAILAKFKEILENIKKVVETVLGAIRKFWEDNGEAIMTAVRTAWDAIVLAVGTAIEFIRGVVETVLGAIKQFWEDHGESIMTAAETAWDFIKDTIDTVLSVLRTIFDAFRLAFEGDWEGFGEKLREAWDTAWEKVKEILETAWDTLVTVVENLIEDILAFFRDTDWGQLAKDIIDGLVDGIRDGAARVAEAVRAIAQAAWDAIVGFFQPGSPSKLMEGMGEDIVQGLVEGIEGNAHLVTRSMQKLINRVLGVAQVLGQAGGFFAGLFNSQVLDPIRETIREIESDMGVLSRGLEDSMGQMFSEAIAAGDIDAIQQALFYETDPQIRADLEEYLALAQLRNEAEAEFVAEQERILELQQQQQQLSFLQAQLDLLQSLADAGLEAEDVLAGITLGLDASLPDLIEAMNRTMEALIGTAEDTLDISSPSGVFVEVAKQAMLGMMKGLESMKGKVAAIAADVMDSGVGGAVVASQQRLGQLSAFAPPPPSSTVSTDNGLVFNFFGPVTGTDEIQRAVEEVLNDQGIQADLVRRIG